MAHYEHLPLFKSSYDVLIELYDRKKDFPKEHKYTLWEKLKNYSLEIVVNIYEINSLRDNTVRLRGIIKTISLVEKCKILIRISKDINILSLKHSTDFDFRWDKNLYTKIKKYKSLFFTPENKWLAIWNLTSQLFANIYLNEMDNYIKRDLKCKYYNRYVDDFVILSLDKNELKILREKIKYFVEDKLDLEVHPNKIIMQRIDQWMNYIWVIIKPFHIYTRNRTYGSFENVLHKYKLKIIAKKVIDKTKILSQINSYMWFIKHSKYKKRFVEIYNKYKKYLDLYFELNRVRMCFVLRDW